MRSGPGDLTVTEAASLVKQGDLSAVELMRSVLDRSERFPSDGHPYVQAPDAEALLEQAREADRAHLRKQWTGPLHGIPVAVKDIFDVAGITTRCGSAAMSDAEPAMVDAEAVAILRRAGAIVVGKTVTQEFAAGVVSAPARNPWDLDRIPGGSSGGTAAAVAVGIGLAGLGSDTGGSIRIPASVCGVVGLKPTFGLVSRRGVFPLSWSLDHVGPITKTVTDAAVLFNLLAEVGATQPSRSPSRARDAVAEIGDGIVGLRIGVPRGFFFERLEPEVSSVVGRAITQLKLLGAEVVEADWKHASAARAVGFLLNRVESAAIHDQRVRSHGHLLGEELRVRLKAGLMLPARDYVRALQARRGIRESMAAYFEEHRLDAMVLPATPGVAAHADDLTVTDDQGNVDSVHVAYTRTNMPINVTGQPSLALPCGFTRGGLPVGMQIVGRPFGEARICRIGFVYEQATRWIDRRPPILETL